MMQQLKVRLTDYINSFTIYDYSAFGWLLIILFFLLILSIVLINSRPKLSGFFIFVVFISIFTAPVAVKILLDKTIRKVVIVDQYHTKLNFAKYLIVTGIIENRGKVNFARCYINTKVKKVSNNKYINILNYIKPIRNRTIVMDKNISVNNQGDFKVIFKKFNYDKKYEVKVMAECY